MLEMIEVYEDFFRALGHETRIEMLMMLAKHKEVRQSKLWQSFYLEQTSIQHHLRTLMQTGIITCRKAAPLVGKAQEGKKTFYKLNLKFIKDTIDDFYKFLQTQDLELIN
ncbi:MAG: helix-turn-helix transcriptional regulator [bacterium]|nr:helix-turn-helix transcriptional regulator [bacterium]